MKPRHLLIACALAAAARLLSGGALAEDVKEAGKTGTATGKKSAEPVSYFREIRPIFQKHCQGCHQPAKAGGKLVVTSYADVMKGSGEDPVIVPGEPDESVLYQEIISEEGEPPAMPKTGEPLSGPQVELVRRWIAEGANDDTPESATTPEINADKPPRYHRPPGLTSLDFSPDGELLAVSGYHGVLLHKADGSGLVARLVGLAERIESVEFSPDGKLLAVAGGLPSRSGELQIWDVERQKLKLAVPVTYDTIYGSSWSSDGRLVAFGCSDNTLRAVEASSGKQVLFQGAHNDWVLDTAFSKDNSHLVSVSRDSSLKLTLVKTEQFIDNITSITPGALKGGLMVVDRHPTLDQLLVGGADGVPKIYRMHREKARKIGDDYNLVRKFDPLPGRVFSVAFHPAGTRVVAGSSSDGKGEVRVYLNEEKESKLLWRLDVPGAVYCVNYRHDGKVVAAGGFDGAVRLIDAEKGSLITKFIPVPLQF